MEPPAHLADPGPPAEARARQPGKWALVRSLNQALKAYAVMPVSPGPGAGGRTPGPQPRASVSPPGRVAKPQGAGRRNPPG